MTTVLLKARFLVRLNHLLPTLLNNNCQQSVRNTNTLKYCSSVSKNVDGKTNNKDNPNVSNETVKKVEETKIILVLSDNSTMSTDLENANKIAKRRGLAIIKVEEPQTKISKPMYKLVNQTEYYDSEIEKEKENNKKDKNNVIKSLKTIQVSSKISIHDLNVKLKSATKLLSRMHKIKIIVMHGSNMQDKIIRSIESSTKNYGTLQKTIKSTTTIFSIVPSSKKDDDTNSHNVNVSTEKRTH